LKKKTTDNSEVDKKHQKQLAEIKEKAVASERERSLLEERLNDMKMSAQQLELKNK